MALAAPPPSNGTIVSRIRARLPADARRLATVLLGFCLVFLVLFAPVVFRGNLLAHKDGVRFFIPAYRTLEKLWDPWMFSGFPVVGDPQEMSWYPLSLLLSLLPGTWNAFVISGYVLAAFLTFLFVRELTDTESGLVAGLAFGLGGFTISNLAMINIVHTAAWLPGILLGLEKLRKAAIKDPSRCALDLLAVRYVFAPEDWRHEIPALSRSERWRLVETLDGVRVYENRSDPPRAWMVSEAITLVPSEVLATVQTSRLPNGDVFDPRRVALLESPVPLGPGPASGESWARVRVIGPGAVDVEVHADGPGLVVLSDIWYPGWVASAAGERLEIHRCDYTIVAVAAPPGDSLVQFRFRPGSFRVGVALTILGLVVGAALGARRWRSDRRGRSAGWRG